VVSCVPLYRSFLSSTGGPAQWPNASRLVEAMCIRLCRKYPAQVQASGVRQRRWNFIIHDYSHIRDLVLSNQQLMENTGLQLFELNQRTLTQWFVAYSRTFNSPTHICCLPTGVQVLFIGPTTSNLSSVAAHMQHRE